MRAVHTVKEIRDALESSPDIGLVPTMGALHAGHEKLIEIARRESRTVVVSIFVNPIQFGPNEDYARYPRTLERDLEICNRLGADFVFEPSVGEMYPLPQRTFVDVTHLTDHLCGKFRPGHFRGVATVVLKLFNIVRPHRAYFGEKDMQQLAVIRRMVADLNVAGRHCRSCHRARDGRTCAQLPKQVSESGTTRSGAAALSGIAGSGVQNPAG